MATNVWQNEEIPKAVPVCFSASLWRSPHSEICQLVYSLSHVSSFLNIIRQLQLQTILAICKEKWSMLFIIHFETAPWWFPYANCHLLQTICPSWGAKQQPSSVLLNSSAHCPETLAQQPNSQIDIDRNLHCSPSSSSLSSSENQDLHSSATERFQLDVALFRMLIWHK